ncbi:microtubule-associated serine/threonine-protein kinase 1-like protein [Lates japonicus]|uniref:Microtubule-associated serine/threonine-protein kinase 1-like protein n=1 Tax=Lates japonicus TaxID=270547 RepID=A0AAD3N7N9_LATJO|nr:microtubule-associated serine/threonine-protein kinase 1-like protein [Lates japonicus]
MDARSFLAPGGWADFLSPGSIKVRENLAGRDQRPLTRYSWSRRASLKEINGADLETRKGITTAITLSQVPLGPASRDVMAPCTTHWGPGPLTQPGPRRGQPSALSGDGESITQTLKVIKSASAATLSVIIPSVEQHSGFSPLASHILLFLFQPLVQDSSPSRDFLTSETVNLHSRSLSSLDKLSSSVEVFLAPQLTACLPGPDSGLHSPKTLRLGRAPITLAPQYTVVK